MNLNEALAIIDSGDPFTVEVVGCDINRKRGGLIHTWECRLNRLEKKQKQSNAAKMTKQDVAEIRAMYGKKDMNRGENFTRNVLILQNGQDTSLVRDLHPPLILTINGKPLEP